MKYLALLFATLFIIGCSTPNLIGKNVKKTYFTGGQLHTEFILDDNTGQNGLLKTYGYDGKITSTVPIHNGVKDGIETGFDNKGRVIWKYTYINGKKEGKQYVYYPNGDVMISYTCVGDVKHGVAKTFNKDGSVNEEVVFDHGRIIN